MSEYDSKDDSKADLREIDSLLYTNDVKKGFIPEGWSSVDDYLECMRKDYEDDLQADEDNRIEAAEDKKFTMGEQWDPQVLQHRSGLPCLVINQIPQFVAQLVGDWRQSRNSIKVIPCEDGDVELADVRSDLIRSIEAQSRADRVYDSAFESQVICGDGAFRVSVEYARDSVFNQDIFIRPIEDSLAVIWDRMSIDPTGRDATHCFVEDILPLKEFKRKWPKADPSTMDKKTKSSLQSTGWIDSENARVVEHWRLIERDRLLCLFQDGSIHVMDGDTLEQTIEAHGQPVKTRHSPCSYAQMILTTGWEILAGPFEYQLSRLPIIRMSGRIINTEGRRYRYGLVRFMKEPSRLRNFHRSVAAEQLGYAPKAQWIAPESAVAGREDQFRKAHLTRDPLMIYNDDASAPPERIEPPAPQMALLNEAELNTQDMKDVTGIHDASLGIKSNETSGRAIMARQKEGDVASITYYDNGNAAVLEGGDVINQLIGQIYDGTRIVRLIGQDEAVKLQKINDPMDPNSPNLAVGRYDTQLTTGSSYTTRRAEAADAMMQAVQVYPEIMQIAGDLVVKSQDWPGAEELAERLRRTIPPQLLSPEEQQAAGQDPQAQAQQAAQQVAGQAQAQMQEMQQQITQLTMQLNDKSRELDIKGYEAETHRMKADADHSNKEGELIHGVINSGIQHSQWEEEVKMNKQTPTNTTSKPSKAPA